MLGKLIGTVPAPLMLLAALLALVTVIVMWKLVVSAGLIGLGQWALVTQTDDPAAAVLALGVPALVTALTVSRLFSRTRHAEVRPFRSSRLSPVGVSR